MNRSTRASDLNEDRKRILLRFHLPAQRAISLGAGPIMLVVSAVLLAMDHSWQLAVNLGSAVVMQVLFTLAYTRAKRGELKVSAILSTIAVFAFGLVAAGMIEGLLGVLIVACAASAIRVSLLSRRFTLWFVAAVVVAYAGLTLVSHLGLYSMMAISPGKKLVLDMALVAFMFLMMLRYLLQIHQINGELFDTQERAAGVQARVLAAVDGIAPVMERATVELEEISAGFAAQASEQAAATSEVNATVGEVGKLAERTAAAAAVAESVSDEARISLVGNSQRLRDLVRGFEKAVEGIDVSRSEITGLTEELDRVEHILLANREVSEQIKVLAVNASIEASAAGEHGRGFGVVAGELRNLIRLTDENLVQSNQVLRGIRDRSRDSTESIRAGAEELLRYYGELRKMAELIEESAERLLEASRNVNEIAHSAREQQAGMSEVGTTMVEIDTAANQLSSSASRLTEVVDRLTLSRSGLRTALDGRA